MKKIVLTGAAGRLGSHLREPLSKMADQLVSTDLTDGIGTLYAGESYVKADLANLGQMVGLYRAVNLWLLWGRSKG